MACLTTSTNHTGVIFTPSCSSIVWRQTDFLDFQNELFNSKTQYVYFRAQIKRDQKIICLLPWTKYVFSLWGDSMRNVTLALYIVQVCISPYENGYNRMYRHFVNLLSLKCERTVEIADAIFTLEQNGSHLPCLVLWSQQLSPSILSIFPFGTFLSWDKTWLCCPDAGVCLIRWAAGRGTAIYGISLNTVVGRTSCLLVSCGGGQAHSLVY